MKLSRLFAMWAGSLKANAETLEEAVSLEEVSQDHADTLFYVALSAKNNAESIMRRLRPGNEL